MTSPFQRLVLAWLPAAAIVVLAGVAIWGESGLMVREQLQERLDASLGDEAALDRENRAIVRRLRHMEADERVLLREVIDATGFVPPETTVVRFPDEESPLEP